MFAENKREQLARLLRKRSRAPRDYPPSYAQERLWFLEQLRPGDTSYNLTSRLQMGGEIDFPTMQRALDEIVERHEILRTIFPAVDGQPVQRVLPELRVKLSLTDLSHLTGPEADAEAQERTRAQTDLAFDITSGPLLRGEVLRHPHGDLLLLAVHHIAVDAWSFDVLVGELNAIYGAFRAGLRSPLPDLPLQYADWAQWQRQTLTGERLEEQLAYWTRALQGLPPVLALPADRPRPAVQSGRGDSYGVRLPKPVRDQLAALGQAEGATLFMTLLAGFVALLHRWSGEADIAVGTPMTNRTRAELERLIGLFTNTAVLRVPVRPKDTFRTLLCRARDATVGAFAHQELPFERLVEALRPSRSLSHNPIFQVMLVVQTREPRPSAAVSPAPVVTTSKFDLSFNIVDDGNELDVLISWAVDLFDADTIVRLGELWGRLLSAACAAPDRRVCELSLVSADEARLLEEWSGEAALRPVERSVPSHFAARAAETPDAVAAAGGSRSLTYGELLDGAGRVARALRACDGSAETLVGLACDDSPRMVAGLLGILAAGRGVVCLPPQLSRDRIAQIVGDARPAVILTEPACKPKLAGLAPPQLLYDESLGGPGGRHEDSSSPGALACVAYPPLHSGRGAGVALDHEALAQLALGAARELGLGPGERVARLSDAGWDTSLDLILASLLSGATYVHVGAPGMADLLGVVEENGVSVLSLPADAWRRWVLASSGAPERTIRTLRLVLLTGEMPDGAILREALKRWRELSGGRVRLVGSYGPPETPFGAMWLDPAAFEAGAWTTAGRPRAGFTAHVLDGSGNSAPFGAPGALCLGGPALGRGSWRRPAADAARLAPDHVGGRPGARLLRTDQTARRRADGVVEVMRRKSDVARERRAAAPRDLAHHTELESRIAAIWAEVLGVERVGLHDNFFHIGGHSLAATRVVARIRKALSAELPLRVLFETPTVAQLAQYVEGLEDAGDSGPRRRAAGGENPLSYAQERLWFLDQLQPGSAVYNIPVTRRWHRKVDAQLVERAINEIVRRHEVLRTVFPDTDGRPTQRVLPELKIPLTRSDLRDEPRFSAMVEAGRLVETESDTPFDLASGPLLRARLVRLGDEEHLLLLTLHHIIADGWSFDVLFRELEAIYTAFAEERPSPLPALELQYSDWARWQREQLAGERLERLLAYWRTMLDNAPPVLALPTDRPRPRVHMSRGATRGFRLPPALRPKVEAFGQEERTTLFMTLLTGFYALLYRWTGQADLVVGSPIANRTRAELEALIGFFVNTLALRARVEPGDTFRALLRRVRDMALGAFAHQDLPFEKLVEEIQPARSLSHNPLFQVMFALRGAPLESAGAAQGEDELVHFAAPPGGTAKFDLSLFVMEEGEQLVLGIEYNAELFDAETIGRLARRFSRLLAAAMDAPDAPLDTLALLHEDEAEAWLAVGRGPAAADTLMVAARVLEQAERTPDAIAVSDEAPLSYAAFAARVREMAAHVAGRTPPGARVGVCAGRTPDAVAAAVALMLAGRTYVPLEPAYPPEFLRGMVEDARLSLVLADGGGALDTFAGIPVSLFDRLEAGGGRTPAATPPPDGLAYIVYTSGSTGRPKGVAMTNRALGNLIEWQIRRSQLGPGARTLHFAARSFDVSMQEIFSTLCAGGTLVIADEETRRDPELLLARLREKEIARLFLPPVALRQLASAAAGAAPATLREIIAAGEQLTLSGPLLRFLERSPHVALYNQYGPSETHVVTEHKVDPAGPTLPPIGRPLLGVVAYVLDAALSPVGPDCPGDLYLGGGCVAQGYFGRPALTAERFAPDPFGAGARLYRTGDRARFRADGALEFLGRSDDQLKVRGFRIEPGEVEAALERHPGVRAAAVTAVGEDERRKLAAFVTPEANAAATPSELRSFLRARLPEHLVPASYTETPSLPLTPSGKLDRRALQRLARDEDHQPYVEPRTPVERRLADIWAEVLGVERVGAHDNFFDLGGHSLLATQVVSRARSSFQVGVPLRVLFEQPTLEGFALAVVGEQAERAGDETARLLAEIEALPDDEVRRRRSEFL
ncbi:MAG TPA: amino acid adenylation domain-containing protein [Pyrinomonadaceae bacterium]|jgi:amino acid adenylation domain-containing protein